MTLVIDISPQTDAWLDLQAKASGTDKATVASRVLEQASENDVPSPPHSPEERLRRFEAWVATVPARPGPPVDDSRDSIYD